MACGLCKGGQTSGVEPESVLLRPAAPLIRLYVLIMRMIA